MADEAPAAAPGATEHPAETSTPAADAAKVITPSEAGKSLAQAREDRKAKLREGDKGKAPDPKGAATRATTAAAGTASGTPPADAAKTETAAPTKADADDPAFVLLREERRVKAEAKKLEAATAAHAERVKAEEADLGVLKTIREAKGKGDYMGALDAQFTEEELVGDGGLFWQLLARVKGPEEVDPAKLGETIDQRVETRLKAAREAEAAERTKAEEAKAAAAKAAKEANDKGFSEAQGRYLASVNTVFQANLDQYPAIQAQFKRFKSADRARDAISAELLDRTEELRNAGKEIPRAAELLATYEAELAAIDPPAPKPATTVTNAWRSQPGSPAPSAIADLKTVEEIRAARKAALMNGRARA
jgi:hypothetical protein